MDTRKMDRRVRPESRARLSSAKKTKWIVALAASALALALAGCSVNAAAADGEQISDGSSVQSGAYANETTRVGAGRNAPSTAGTAGGARAGSGIAQGYGGAQGYGDSCTAAGNAVAAGNADYVPTEEDKTLSLTGYGSAGALADTDPSLADMLTYAIQDEYLAYAEYDAILADFSGARPFVNILRAEKTHIDALLPLFEAYGVAVPEDEGASRAAAAPSLTSAYEAGVNAEVNNIAMYDTFLEQDLPSDVSAVFASLQRASENHLRAFQNQL